MIYWSFIKKKNSVALNNLIKWVGELYNIFTFDLHKSLSTNLYKIRKAEMILHYIRSFDIHRHEL
jgi:hypothetical protein